MTRLEQLIVKVGNNRHTPEDVAEIKTFPNRDVDQAITEIASVSPYWVIQNINQANIWGK